MIDDCKETVLLEDALITRQPNTDYLDKPNK